MTPTSRIPEHRTDSVRRPGSFDTDTNHELRKGISQYLPSLLVGITFVQIVFTHFSENDVQQRKKKARRRRERRGKAYDGEGKIPLVGVFQHPIRNFG